MSRDAGDVAYDDEIDLRAYATVLLKWKWIIAGITVLAVAAAGFLSFVVLTPTYEATQLVALPAARGQNLLKDSGEVQLGMTAQAYREYATSLTVMENVLQLVESRLTVPATPTSLQKRFEASVDQNAGLLEVTARANSADEAHWLAQAWLAAFQNQVVAHVQEQVSASINTSENELEEVTSAFAVTQEALASFDQEHGLRVLDSQLTQMEEELTTAEARLRSLETHLLPTEMARLEFLESAVASESPSLEEPMLIPGSSSGGAVVGSVSTLNPTYLRLNEDLSMTRARIVSYEAERASLHDTIASLPQEIASLRKDLVSLQAQRDRLLREFNTVEARLMQAQQRRDDLTPLASRVQDLARVVAVSPAAVPDSPVAPRPVLNMAVAAVLAGFVAVFYVFLREWWEAGRPETDPAPGATAADPASHESWEAGR